MNKPQPILKYDKWIDRKISGKPADTRAFLRYSYYVGVNVLEMLSAVQVDDVSLSSRVSLPEGKHQQFYGYYEDMMESAANDPDQFVYGFHRRMTELSADIRNNASVYEFSEFFSMFFRNRIGFAAEEDEDTKWLGAAYESLILATFNYLTPSKSDLTRLVCGYTADGEILYCDKYYPYANEITSLALLEMRKTQDERIQVLNSLCRKYAAQFGYTNIGSNGDLNRLQELNAFRTEQILNLSPYINEYTYDMLPDTAHIYRYNMQAFDVMDVRGIDPEAFRVIVESLNHRARTLPANGIRFDFSCNPRVPEENRLQTLVMKEVFHRDRIVMLYKLRFTGQDFCGYYDTKDQFFYSQIMTNEEQHMAVNAYKLYSMILYLYEACTAGDGERKIRDFGEVFLSGVTKEGKNKYPISAAPCPLEGEPRITLAGRGEAPDTAGAPSEGAGERKKRTLQGYIRKLDPGDLPTEEQTARAEELGFALAEDEVYEEPFL